jgi:plasmid stabilization system protein ParE
VNVTLTAEARSDVLQAFEAYEQRREGLGTAYRDALDATIARILRYPLAFEPGRRGLRRALVSRFPHAIYFRVYPEAVVVAGVLSAIERH